VLAVTTVYNAPSGFTVQVPYHTGLVRFEEGPVVTRRISCDSPDSPIVYGYKFAPDITHG
jgi:uncharacterized OB-fold protein